jgi:hypothetical protein
VLDASPACHRDCAIRRRVKTTDCMSCGQSPTIDGVQPKPSRSREPPRIPADVIGFVSQFFASTSGALSSTSALCRRPRTRHGSRRAATAASRQSARRNPIPPRGVLHDNAHSPGERPWLTGATGQERQPVPGAASLASHRNFINRSRRALRYGGVCSLRARNEVDGRRTGVTPVGGGGFAPA